MTMLGAERGRHAIPKNHAPCSVPSAVSQAALCRSGAHFTESQSPGLVGRMARALEPALPTASFRVPLLVLSNQA